jgi:hypothetical protein
LYFIDYSLNRDWDSIGQNYHNSFDKYLLENIPE